jgi:hypothetical protein
MNNDTDRLNREEIESKMAEIERLADEVREMKDRIRFLEDHWAGKDTAEPRWTIYEHNSDWSNGGDVHDYFRSYASALAFRDKLIQAGEGTRETLAIILYDPREKKAAG